MDMIPITEDLFLDERHLQWRHIRSSGPGGQNVNKVSTAVQLRCHLTDTGLPAELQARARKLAGKRLNAKGVIIIDARRYRAQERNRSDALQRLLALLRKAAVPKTPRIPTKPTAASRRKRLADKQHRSKRKNLRRVRSPEIHKDA